MRVQCYQIEKTNAQKISISNITISDEDYQSGNPYNTTCNVCVQSGDFAGLGSFEFDVADFRLFTIELLSLYNELHGKAILKDIGYGSEVVFQVANHTGHIQVSGTLFGEARTQSVVFDFFIDQTDLRQFCQRLYKDFGEQDKYRQRAAYNRG